MLEYDKCNDDCNIFLDNGDFINMLSIINIKNKVLRLCDNVEECN